MQAKCSVIKSRLFSWLTLIVFSVFSIMPTSGYAAVTQTVGDDGRIIYTTDSDTVWEVGSFDQADGAIWEFNLGNGNLMVNVDGNHATTWEGKTDIYGPGILGVFNRLGFHIKNGAEINLHNADFIGSAMRFTDQSTATNLKLEGDNNGGYLLNEGDIRGTGSVALLGRAVENRGEIGTVQMPLNRIMLAGGEAMTIGLSADNLVSVDVTAAVNGDVNNFEETALTDQIKNSGNITGHKITLDAKGVDSVFEKAINLTGEIKAVDVGEVDGEIVMMSLDDVYTNAILKAAKIEMNTDGKIENAGTIDAKEFKEHGYTFKNTGTLKGGEVFMDNTDGAADISGTVSSNLSDTGDINLVAGVNLGDDVILTADSNADGVGKITFSDGVSLDGNGHKLTLKASEQSILRSMDDLGDLILVAQTVGAQFTTRDSIAMDGDLTVNSGATLNGGYSVTVGGGDVIGSGVINMSGGTFTVIGNGNFGGSQDWNFNRLIFGDGETEATTQKTGSNKITIAQDWTIKELHTLRAGTSTWDVSWGSGAMTDVTKIVGGVDFAIALSGEGKVYSWGHNHYGQLGDGTTYDRYTPVAVSGLSDVVDIAAGGFHGLALISGGTVKAWGMNYYGQLGNGANEVYLTVPVAVSGLSGVEMIAAGQRHSLALLSDGTVRAWGINNLGQLGDGTNTHRNLPVSVLGLSGVTKIDTRADFSLALLDDKSVMSWGENNYGQLGDGTTTNRNTAVQVSGLSNVTDIAAGYYHGLALLENQTVQAWGRNVSGQLGDGTNTNRLTAVAVSGLTGVTYIGAGGYTSIARVGSQNWKAWGDNYYGQLGDGTTSNRNLPTTLNSLSGSSISNIVGGGSTSYALMTDGTLKSWGGNSYGQLGEGTTYSRSSPEEVVSAVNLEVHRLTGAKKLVGGGAFTLALLDDGTVMAWGQNSSGQLGDDTLLDRYTAVKVVGLSDVIDIAAGNTHSLAVLKDGTVKAWGANGAGTLGDGTTTSRQTPVVVSGLSGVVSVAAGVWHSLALLANGTVQSWGINSSGQLGDGTTTNRLTPVSVIGVSGVTAIAAGYYHSLALLSTGSIKAWGKNDFGQLGDGTTTNSSTAVNVTGITNAIAIVAGYAHSLALSSTGGVKAWGYNGYGQLGDGTRSTQLTAIDVPGVSGVLEIGGGSSFSTALLSNGTVKSWGDNFYGQIGEHNPWVGYRADPSVMAQVESAQGISTGGTSHSMIIRPDGSILGFGLNWKGQLGDNQPITIASPTYAGILIFDPFIVDGNFVAEDSTVSYSGDVVIGGRSAQTVIADVPYKNLDLPFLDYIFRDRVFSPGSLSPDAGPIVIGRFTFDGKDRSKPIVDMSNVVPTPPQRLIDIMGALDGEHVNPHEIFKMLFGNGSMEMRQINLRTGVNAFNVDPSTMGFDRGIDQFRTAIFSAQAASLDQRNALDQSLKTGTVIQNVTGNVRVIASDGKIYDATAGVELQEGDQIVTDKAAKVELVKGADKVTVSEGSAVQVQKQAEEGKPIQDLLTLAFGQVSIAVSEDTVSSFVVQTPTGISGQRG